MQLLPLQKLDGCRLWIATLGLALFAPAFLMSADKTQAPADTLARVRQTGTFGLGYYADAGRFSYQDETGKLAGYAISLCQQIATDLNHEIGVPNLVVVLVMVHC